MNLEPGFEEGIRVRRHVRERKDMCQSIGAKINVAQVCSGGGGALGGNGGARWGLQVAPAEHLQLCLKDRKDHWGGGYPDVLAQVPSPLGTPSPV